LKEDPTDFSFLFDRPPTKEKPKWLDLKLSLKLPGLLVDRILIAMTFDQLTIDYSILDEQWGHCTALCSFIKLPSYYQVNEPYLKVHRVGVKEGMSLV